MTSKNHNNHLKHLIDSYSKVLKEYRSLSIQPELTELEAKRLENILKAAYSDDRLSLLLSEIDEAIFNAQESSEFHNYHKLQNEVARIAELIGGEKPCHKDVCANSKLNLAGYQPMLREYRQLLQVSVLSEANATRMEQILDTACEDELLALLLDAIDESLVKSNTAAKFKQPKEKQIAKTLRRQRLSAINLTTIKQAT
ncbi:MAG: hypothetical protein AAF572_28925 [Cyanobacteria bacterium P01_B01_bin.77]